MYSVSERCLREPGARWIVSEGDAGQSCRCVAALQHWKGHGNGRCSPVNKKCQTSLLLQKGKEGGAGELLASQPHLGPSESCGATPQRSRLNGTRYCKGELVSLSGPPPLFIYKMGYPLTGVSCTVQRGTGAYGTCCPSPRFFHEPESQGLCSRSH